MNTDKQYNTNIHIPRDSVPVQLFHAFSVVSPLLPLGIYWIGGQHLFTGVVSFLSWIPH